MTLQSVKRIKDAHYAHCLACDTQWDSLQPFWSLSKTLAMHEKGMGHKVGREFRLYKIADETPQSDVSRAR